MSTFCVPCSALSRRHIGRAENCKVFQVPTQGAECYSKHRPIFEGLNWPVLGWSDSLTTLGWDCHKMYTFLVWIVTVSDGVTGVSQCLKGDGLMIKTSKFLQTVLYRASCIVWRKEERKLRQTFLYHFVKLKLCSCKKNVFWTCLWIRTEHICALLARKHN